jgi:hypothetical protein
MTKQLTGDQLAALHTYAKENGDRWKMHLLSDWERGRIDVPELQQIRNTFGPSWLRRFKLKPPVIAFYGDEAIERARGGAALFVKMFGEWVAVPPDKKRGVLAAWETMTLKSVTARTYGVEG